MPENKFRAAVIGSTSRGDYGHSLDDAFMANDRVELVAIADDNAEGLAATVAEHQPAEGYSDYRRMLDEVKPDVVAIAPRWLDQREEMLLECANRGVHMYVEKPYCRTLESADKIIDACERTHAKLAIAHPTHYSPKLERVKKLLDAGRLGQVLEYRGRGKEDRRGGAEDLWVLGTHVIDMIRFLGGQPKWCFATLEKDGKPVTADDVYEGAEGLGPLAGNAVHAMYGMADGTKAYFASVAGTAASPPRYGLQVFGSHGIIEVLEGTMPTVKALRDRAWSPARSGKEWIDVSSSGFNKPEKLSGPFYESRHRMAVDDLLDAIEEMGEPKCGMHDGRGVVEMIMAVFESHRQGGPVELPLENRQHPLTMLEK